jgi:flagellar protein FliO/FliZ
MTRMLFLLCLYLTAGIADAAPGQATDKGPLVTNPIGIGNFMQMAFGLLIVIGAILAMTWIIRRMGYVQARVSGAMKILGGISLGQRERVVLMQIGEQQVVVGITPGNIRTLLVLDKPISMESAGQVAVEGSFAQKLQTILKGKQS